MCGSRQPAPSTSQALSAAAAATGGPAGMPVAAAAAAPMTPSSPPGATSSGNMPGSIGKACHFQSRGPAHCRRR